MKTVVDSAHRAQSHIILDLPYSVCTQKQYSMSKQALAQTLASKSARQVHHDDSTYLHNENFSTMRSVIKFSNKEKGRSFWAFLCTFSSQLGLFAASWMNPCRMPRFSRENRT